MQTESGTYEALRRPNIRLSIQELCELTAYLIDRRDI